MTSLRVLLALLDLEALAALCWAFFSPSESGQAVLLWLSAERTALAAVLLIIFLVLLATTLQMLRNKSITELRSARLDSALIERRQLAPGPHGPHQGAAPHRGRRPGWTLRKMC